MLALFLKLPTAHQELNLTYISTCRHFSPLGVLTLSSAGECRIRVLSITFLGFFWLKSGPLGLEYSCRDGNLELRWLPLTPRAEDSRCHDCMRARQHNMATANSLPDRASRGFRNFYSLDSHGEVNEAISTLWFQIVVVITLSFRIFTLWIHMEVDIS